MHHPTLCASIRAARWLAAGLLALGALLTIGAPPAARAASVVYVRAGASGTGDGSSWANAYTRLADALSAAGSGSQIWVAAGTYTPSNTGDRTASFTLKDGVGVYGGFSGSETALAQRNWAANLTILSGDLSGDDGANFASNGENSYHVVTGADGATLDGFTVTSGNANGNGGTLDNTGAGIFNAPGSPTLSHLIISGNTASYTGGGVYNNFGSSPSLTNVKISGNSAQYGGGIYNNNGSSPALTNVLISGNLASWEGGGIYANASSSPTLTNVTLSGNTASNGAGLFVRDGSPQVLNSIIWGNYVGGALSIYTSTPTVSYSLIEGGYTGTSNLDADPQFFSPAAPGSTPTAAGDYRLQVSSPAVDAGDNSLVAATTDLAGSPRQIDVPGVADTGSGAAPIVDLGAYELPAVAISNVVRLNPPFGSTSAASVHFGVAFATSVSGVDASDFALTVVDGSLAGASVASVNGSGQTYAVIVNTGSGVGTLRLEPAPMAQVLMASGAPAGISPFTSGQTYQIDRPAPAEPVFAGIIADSGAQTSTTTNDPTIGLYGTAEAGATVLVTRLGDQKNWSIGADQDGNWSIADLGALLSEGSFAFTAYQIDTDGIHSPDTSPFTVTIDLTAPAAPTIASITTDGGVLASGSTGDPTIGLNGTAEAGSTIALTRVGVGPIGTTTADANGDWSFDYTGTALAVGSYSFTATASDAAGNTSSPSGSFAVTVRATGAIIYVRPGGAGAADGTSWANALASPASALAVALSGDQIWVAAGSYTPANSSDRASSFTLKSGVAMYGGFAGTETLLSQRAWATNVTILTGDLTGDGESFPHNSDNSYHVVVGADGATLDGFTISGGNADADDAQSVGGGIYNPSASPTLAHLTITSNYASNGGGMYNTTSSPTITAVTFSGNSANNSGAGMYNNASSPTITDSAFSNNTAAVSGGGLLNNNGSHPSLSNITFSNNSAKSGGGMYNWNSSPTLSNVTFSNNAATKGLGGGMVNNGGSNSTLANVSFTGNSATSYGGAIHNGASTLTLMGGTISGNTAAGNGGAVHNVVGSTLRMSGVTISGNTSTGGSGGALYNIASTAAFTDTTISQNTVKGAGGAILNYSTATLSLASSTISGNSGYYGGGIESYGALTVSESTFSANTATAGGGGIDMSGGAITVTASLFHDNIATTGANYGSGGGLQIGEGRGSITNTTFSGNQANGPLDDGGGAVMVYSGTLTLNNVTIAGNSTTSNGSTGNGAGGIGVNSGATVTLKNSIVAGNTSSAGKPDVSGKLSSGGHNLVGDTTGSSGLTNGSNGDMAGALAATLDAKLATLASNGGPTQTRALLSGSPAIDAGDAATCAAADQRGIARSTPCDIGAYEHRSYSVGLPLIRMAP